MGQPSTHSAAEVAAINVRGIKAFDKWNRMFHGLSSDLVKYEHGVVHLEIGNTESTYLSTHSTAVSCVRSWVRYSPELAGAVGFFVLFQRRSVTGTAVDATADAAETLANVAKRLADEEQNPRVVTELFAGRLMDCPEGDPTPREDEEEVSFARHHRVRPPDSGV